MDPAASSFRSLQKATVIEYLQRRRDVRFKLGFGADFPIKESKQVLLVKQRDAPVNKVGCVTVPRRKR